MPQKAETRYHEYQSLDNESQLSRFFTFAFLDAEGASANEGGKWPGVGKVPPYPFFVSETQGRYEM